MEEREDSGRVVRYTRVVPGVPLLGPGHYQTKTLSSQTLTLAKLFQCSPGTLQYQSIIISNIIVIELSNQSTPAPPKTLTN